MASDIRTIDTVTVDDQYRVTVAECDDGDEYEAAVTGATRSTFGQAFSAMLTMQDGGDRWRSVSDAPRVVSERRWWAVGQAVEAYEDWLAEESEVDDGE